MRGWVEGAVLAAALLAMPLPLMAQEADAPPSGSATVPVGPPAASDAIFWYPAPSRCTYATPEQKAAFRFADPETWRFSFLVMVETSTGVPAGGPVERGYVMNDGVLRELEKVRSGADKDGNTVTVWRAVGEPRINVNITLRPSGTEYEQTTFRGRMTLIRGDGKTETDIVGACGS